MENEKLSTVMDNVEKVIVGKRTSIALLLTAMLAGGHILIEDVPSASYPRSHAVGHHRLYHDKPGNERDRIPGRRCLL